MNDRQRARWEITRTRGFLRYVLLYWVVIWGGAMIAFSSTFDYLFTRRGLTLEEFELKIPFFLIAGFIAGTVVWLIAERQYRKAPAGR